MGQLAGQFGGVTAGIGGLLRDQSGQMMLEQVLLMAAFVLPMYIVMMHMLEVLNEIFGMMTFFASLPFF
jgi:hypothetical protein